MLVAEVCGPVGTVKVTGEKGQPLKIKLPPRWKHVEDELNQRIAEQKPFRSSDGRPFVITGKPSDEQLGALDEELRMLTDGELFLLAA